MKLDEHVRELTGVRSVRRGERIQSLWQGYGQVVLYHLDDGPVNTVIVKHVQPPPGAHPRKLRSYCVERAWYTSWSSRCTPASRVPRCWGSWSDGRESVFVLEDMYAAGFPSRKHTLNETAMDACVHWLANFHSTFLHASPQGLWEEGTYWHLATRPDEWRAMRNEVLKRQAPALDRCLREARFRTLVHGDAKLANFCFGPEGVAAVDFQYVGGGCGMKDLAYFLGRSPPLQSTNAWLDRYFSHLHSARGGRDDEGRALEAEWRELYPMAIKDFERFLDGWR